MKLYLIFLIASCFSIHAYAQTHYKYNDKQGYRFIRKAEKSLQAGQLSKAEKSIVKAKASHFGFCGTAWSEANSRINLLEVQILNKQKNYDQALVILDSLKGCYFGADCVARDSLKIITLFLKFGKEKVKDSFKKINVINNVGDPELDLESGYWIFLEELNYKFWFKTDVPDYLNGKKVARTLAGGDFYRLVKNQPFYKLIE